MNFRRIHTGNTSRKPKNYKNNLDLSIGSHTFASKGTGMEMGMEMGMAMVVMWNRTHPSNVNISKQIHAMSVVLQWMRDPFHGKMVT